jgi:hypothetical protein
MMEVRCRLKIDPGCGTEYAAFRVIINLAAKTLDIMIDIKPHEQNK